MKTFWIVICTAGFLVIVSLMSAMSGIYNVSARDPHWSLTSFLLETARDHSISRHSATLKLPPLDKPELALRGALHFDETCWKCHGAPGINPEEYADGLYPAAPPLESVATDLKIKNIFWTIDNGIKMTGMPSFGVTHSKDEILAMVAFIEKLPTLDARRYRQFVDQAKSRFGGEASSGTGSQAGPRQ